MNKMNASALLLLLFVPIALQFIPMSASASIAKWTFMVYLDADNNLDPCGVDDISEMQAVGSTDDVNVIVLFDRWHEMCGFNGSEILYVHKGWSETVWGDWTNEYELNMGDPATLAWFIKFAATNYPADRYALILWDHGGHWEGVCWDWTNNDDQLTIDNLYDVFVASPVTINLLGFDACLMASVEVAYALKLAGNVNIVTASEEWVPLDGYPYDMILEDLVQNPTWDEHTLAIDTVNEYIASYTGLAVDQLFATLAAIDLNNVDVLVNYIRDLTNELIAHFKEYKGAITGAKDAADRYWLGFWYQGAYIDLHQFVDNLRIREPSLEIFSDPILQAWDSVVIHAKCCLGPHTRDGAGLTIYFPRNSQLFYTPELYFESVTAFAEYTNWYTLLTMYFARGAPRRK